MFRYDAESSPIVKTGAGTDDAWSALVQTLSTPNDEGFTAQLQPMQDRKYVGLSPAEIADLKDPVDPAPVIFVADDEALSELESVLVVAGEYIFRCVLGQVWSVENNLRLMNMDVSDFFGVTRNGVFEGF
jgi:hypothetical protein